MGMRLNRVVPFWQNAMRHKVNLHFLFRRDLLARFINMLVQMRLTPQPRLGFSRPDELENGLVADQWFARPITANEREKPMLNRVPFGGARGQVRHGDRDVKCIGQLL